MTGDRLPSELEAAALMRRAAADGDFAAMLKKGDPDRGVLLLVVTSRGRHVACLERVPSLSREEQWQVVGPAESASSADVAEFLAKRTRFDTDLWLIELDVAQPERFIAETTSGG
ncbi:MAG: DUF1491 family protein [Pseudomonadota bacterium]|nr:DUF1491 family protein [Pseudomonadota bacterium]